MRLSDLERFLEAGATRSVLSTADAASGQVPAEKSSLASIDLWRRLGAAATNAGTALTDEDSQELAAALRCFADAAKKLAAAVTR